MTPCPGACFNVTDLFGLTAPAGGVVERSRRTRSVDVDEIRGQTGNFEDVCPLTYGTEVVEIEGRGDLPHADLTPGGITPGTAFISQQNRTEYNTRQPSFRIQSTNWFSTVS